MPSNIVINIGAMYKKSLLNICTALRGNYLFAARKRGLNVSGANTTCVAFKGGLEFPNQKFSSLVRLLEDVMWQIHKAGLSFNMFDTS